MGSLAAATELETSEKSGVIETAIDHMLRGQSDDFDAYLRSVFTGRTLKSNRAIVHCSCVACTANGMIRFKDLAVALSCKIVDYAIPRSEVESARKRDALANTTAHTLALRKKAAALFRQVKKSGEGGELLLYILLETALGLPQLICKMPLKTNANMEVHGVDGVHIGVDSAAGRLSLYWGQSKLYKSFQSATSECLDDLRRYLTDQGGTGSPLDRDLYLIRDNLDFANNKNLEDAILYFVTRESPGFNEIEFRGAALIGFDSEVYEPCKKSPDMKSLCERVLTESAEWLEKIRTAIANRAPLDQFHLEIFLIPFPTVQAFRDAFLKEL